ncbi:hypothetical protein OJAV_G00140620 [Oryzias javanicus]|uniref:Uncharacterized protein n=1 Tax=Oryzias javanicus TaxID=123683 RepID=A0A437CM46_ORYJA|nr:hypothetical protein OJAV_G00140620 [Oryzias javanicus]
MFKTKEICWVLPRLPLSVQLFLPEQTSRTPRTICFYLEFRHNQTEICTLMENIISEFMTWNHGKIRGSCGKLPGGDQSSDRVWAEEPWSSPGDLELTDATRPSEGSASCCGRRNITIQRSS